MLSWKVILTPLAIVAIVLLPLLETTLEIELMQSNMPIHWRFFIAAMIGGCLGALMEILRKVFNIDKAKEAAKATDIQLMQERKIGKLNNDISNLRLQHQITERDIFLNAYKLTEEWNKINQEIADKTEEIKKIE